MTIAVEHRSQLERVKEAVRNSYNYFYDNYTRYNEFRRFIFSSSLTEQDRTALSLQSKPDLEFNVLEAYISRLLGEFSKQEPSILVMADDGAQVDPQTIKIVEDHVRHILFDANKNGFEYQVYKDMLSGGFSVGKIWTEYSHEMSFNQVIRVGRVFDPILCGFDPLSRLPHKGDSRFCFELYPVSKGDFAKQYPEKDINSVTFTRSLDGFNWSYSNNREDILLICDFYEKKKKRIKIVKLIWDNSLYQKYPNLMGRLKEKNIIVKEIMKWEDYKEFLGEWEKEGIIPQPPSIVGEPRWTDIETIVRYRLIESELLEYEETSYKFLPLIFFDGNSIDLRYGESSGYQQMTRPYVYQAKGLQKLKNYAGQCLANDMENMVMHKFIVKKEALPDEQPYLDALTNIQRSATVVVKAFKDNDPNVPIQDPIREIARIGAPPEVINAFTLTDQMTQTILGSYDASLGINDNQLSGVAIVEGATQSNAAAMPFIVGFLQGLQQLANAIIDLLPKYVITPRSIPLIGKDGKRSYQNINGFNYPENSLQIKVEAGVSFSIQKDKAFKQIIALQQVNQLFAQFMNEEGLDVLLDNMEFRGIDVLKDKTEAFQQKIKQMQAQQQQMQQQQMQQAGNPAQLAQMKMQIEQAKLQQNQQKMQIDAEQEQQQLEIDRERLKVEKMDIHADMIQSQHELQIQASKAAAERHAKDVELEIHHEDLRHDHMMDIAKHHHEVRVHEYEREKGKD